MPRHRHKVGQSVLAHAPGMPRGPYVITRLLPPVENEAHYQGKTKQGVVRALLESQIRAVPEGLRIDERVLPQRRSR